MLLFSLVCDAQTRFRQGTGRLLQHLWLLGCFPGRSAGPPTEQAYRRACAKLPVPLVVEALSASHMQARSDKDPLYEGLRVTVVDGTKLLIPRNTETIDAYGLGSGVGGEAYHPRIHAGVFLDLATGTISNVDLDHGQSAEREILLEHAAANNTSTLYLTDAGYNGMAFVQLLMRSGHHLLMELKSNKLVDTFRRRRRRSQIFTITLTRDHLKGYPAHRHLAGKTMRIRLVRTRGTTKLRARVLLTTLLDETRYRWQDLAKLYLQRWTIELAIRHLKKSLRIERIIKQALHRIRQLLLAAFILFNLSAIIRNHVRKPSLFPRKGGVRLPCFEFILQLADGFLLAPVCPKRGQKTEIKRRLRAIRSCCFIYDPWRIQPKIRRLPPPAFTRDVNKEEEIARCEAVRKDMQLLGMKYGQITSSS